MAKYRAVAKFKIHEGKSGEFRVLAAQCLAAVRAREPGTLLYEWFMNAAETECVVVETYDSDAALMAHTRNVGALVGQMLKIADCSVDMLADPTPEIREALKRMPLNLYGRLQGLD